MSITDSRIDKGRAFDWGRISDDYAKYRDIYPDEFYRKIINRNLCVDGQKVLDLGTGTGVLPRNMYEFGAEWTGTDISENQIEKAKTLSKGMNISYFALPAAAYAVFECVGAVPDAMQHIQERILSEWLPAWGYEYAPAPDIEVYSMGGWHAPSYSSEVWLPVLQKKTTYEF